MIYAHFGTEQKEKQKENLIEMMRKDEELGLYIDYAKEIRKQVNILNELIKEAEGMEVPIKDGKCDMFWDNEDIITVEL